MKLGIFNFSFLFLKKIPALLFLSLGSIPGALVRWQLSNDFLVNVIGSLILGFLFGLKLKNSYYLIFGIGFCGSLTTFSGWIFSLYHFLVMSHILQFFLILSFQISMALAASLFGFFLAKKLAG